MAEGFVSWYSNDLKHSGIGYLSPAQKHAGDVEILAARDVEFAQTKQRNPSR
jgi:putative transposase